MTNKNQLGKIHEACSDRELDILMNKLEEFNMQNYKDAAINVALETGDRDAFNKLVRSE